MMASISRYVFFIVSRVETMLLFHLRETVDALRCADFEGFFGRSPGVGG